MPQGQVRPLRLRSRNAERGAGGPSARAAAYKCPTAITNGAPTMTHQALKQIAAALVTQLSTQGFENSLAYAAIKRTGRTSSGSSPPNPERAGMDEGDPRAHRTPGHDWLHIHAGGGYRHHQPAIRISGTHASIGVQTGPHVMVVGPRVRAMVGYSRTMDVADARQPYVMYPGTPYEHLMLPTK